MDNIQPHVIDAGSGPVILCLHSSTGSGKQWNSLIERLAKKYRVIAPDLYGYGKSPDWPEDKVLSLDAELDLIASILDPICGSFHVIGHSFGAAVAFALGLKDPSRIRSLIVFEPVLFNILFQMDDLDAQAEVWMLQDDIHWLLVDERFSDAAERFIDYWSGEGIWKQLPDWQQKAIEKRMKKVRADFDATMSQTTPLEDYRKLEMPILFLYGLKSPRATQLIAEWLTKELPNAEVRGLLPLGHMGPVTHADNLNAMIARFIDGQPNGVLPHQVKRGFKQG